MTKGDNFAIAMAMLDAKNPRPQVRCVIEVAYRSRWGNRAFETSSDGISWIVSFSDDYGIPHPVGVGHDFLYRAGTLSPFWKLHWTERDGRRWADAWYKTALSDFGHPHRAAYHYIGLRMFGGVAWGQNRDRDAETRLMLTVGHYGRGIPPLDDVI